MHYFVTGATGFIGLRLVQRLLVNGHQVTAFVRSSSKIDDLVLLGAQLAEGDITDKASVHKAIQSGQDVDGQGVDGIFHLAAENTMGKQDKHRMGAINVEGTRNVLELALELAIPRVVYTSSTTVFSHTKGQIADENYQHDPSDDFLNDYERNKWLAHYEVAKPMIAAGLPLIIVMPSLVYGTDDPSGMGAILRQYLHGKLHFLPQGAIYSWAYLDDVVKGHILAMEKGKIGEEYILSGEHASLEGALELSQAITGIRAPRLRLSPWMMRLNTKLMHIANAFYPLEGALHPETLRSVTDVSYLSSHKKASRELGYEARGLREGLSKVLEHELIHMKIANETSPLEKIR